MLYATVLISAMLPQGMERVSITSTGAEVAGWSYFSDMSPDGRFVTFTSAVDGIVPGDTNGRWDLFLRDRHTGTVEWISQPTYSAASPPGTFLDSSISADGRFIAFESRYADHVANDTNASADIFVFDRASGATRRVSVTSTGGQAAGPSKNPRISADGRWVAFYSKAINLVATQSSSRNIYLYDRLTGVTQEMLSGPSSSAGWDLTSPYFDLSRDGRYVSFSSDNTDLVPGDQNGTVDIFRHDLILGTTARVSVSDTGMEAGSSGNYCNISAIAADGSTVAFLSNFQDLIPGLSTASRQVFVRDLRKERTALASMSANGGPGAGQSENCAISGNGRFVAFQALNQNFVPGIPSAYEVMVRDRASGTTELITVPHQGLSSTLGTGIGYSGNLVVSLDGRYVGFEEKRDDLVLGDTNQAPDVFVRDRGAAAASSNGTILLTADYGLIPGQPATLRWFCAPPNANYVIAAAGSDAGGHSVFGHIVDLVPPYRTVAMGNTGPGRHGEAQTPTVPPLLPGTEVYFEMLAVDGAGVIHDSNPVARPVL